MLFIRGSFDRHMTGVIVSAQPRATFKSVRIWLAGRHLRRPDLNSQIFGTSQYAKFGEKTIVIGCRFEDEIFLRLNHNNSLICMRYAQIMSDPSSGLAIFKMAAVGLHEIHGLDGIVTCCSLVPRDTLSSL